MCGHKYYFLACVIVSYNFANLYIYKNKEMQKDVIALFAFCAVMHSICCQHLQIQTCNNCFAGISIFLIKKKQLTNNDGALSK